MDPIGDSFASSPTAESIVMFPTVTRRHDRMINSVRQFQLTIHQRFVGNTLPVAIRHLLYSLFRSIKKSILSMNRTTRNVIKIKRTKRTRHRVCRNKVMIVTQPRLRIAAIRKRKFTSEEVCGKKKRVRLSEKPTAMMIILPYRNDIFSKEETVSKVDKHVSFFQKKTEAHPIE